MNRPVNEKDIREYLKTETCPRCKGEKLALIVYGHMTSQLPDHYAGLQNDKLIISGGCSIEGEDLFCWDCERPFSGKRSGAYLMDSQKQEL